MALKRWLLAMASCLVLAGCGADAAASAPSSPVLVHLVNVKSAGDVYVSVEADCDNFVLLYLYAGHGVAVVNGTANGSVGLTIRKACGR